MKGCPVEVERLLSMSPKVKINVIAMMNPKAVFVPTDHIIALGSVIEAS